MSKRRKIEIEDDGTPVDAGPDETAPPDNPTPNERAVIWTAQGEQLAAQSEHGTHAAGDRVMTAYADLLIERGFAEEEE